MIEMGHRVGANAILKEQWYEWGSINIEQKCSSVGSFLGVEGITMAMLIFQSYFSSFGLESYRPIS